MTLTAPNGAKGKNVKHFGALLLVVAVLILGTQIGGCVHAEYHYSKNVGSYWSLAEKASTIKQKSEYMDKFVDALSKENFAANNAIILATPDNETASNNRAVKSLQDRLHEIQGMNPKSFEYQAAIQQITAQEQGEAHGVLSELEGAWLLANGYFFCWDWIGGTIAGFALIVGFIGGAILANTY
jgi:hypothetical protein